MGKASKFPRLAVVGSGTRPGGWEEHTGTGVGRLSKGTEKNLRGALVCVWGGGVELTLLKFTLDSHDEQ